MHLFVLRYQTLDAGATVPFNYKTFFPERTGPPGGAPAHITASQAPGERGRSIDRNQKSVLPRLVAAGPS